MSAATSDACLLASWLVGDFSNWDQAIANPPFFAHVRVCIRPLLVPLSPEGIWLYSEQSYDYELQHPYRTAVLQIVAAGDHLVIHNHRLHQAESYFGAARERSRLASLIPEQVHFLAGCDQLVSRTPSGSFRGAVEPGKKCCVVRNGRQTYLASEFEIWSDRFHSLDRGYDPNTNERVWGSVAGAFEFSKKVSFAHELKDLVSL
ncbi:MAG: chorismate-binding protein [Oscillatoriales cyanobacterium SM2_2_1]|nr:chorismate-binding protein [Oscillatoriales cyanobacterium SM2_2_1]